MTKEEIFKDKPELLQVTEVKVLCSYFEKTYKKLYKRFEELESFEFKVLDLAMHSDVMLKDGKPSKEQMKKILEILNK